MAHPITIPSRPAPPRKKATKYIPPAWLTKLAQENSAQFGFPLDTVQTKIKALIDSGEANPYRKIDGGPVSPCKRASVDEAGPSVKRWKGKGKGKGKGKVIELSQESQDEEIVEREPEPEPDTGACAAGSLIVGEKAPVWRKKSRVIELSQPTQKSVALRPKSPEAEPVVPVAADSTPVLKKKSTVVVELERKSSGSKPAVNAAASTPAQRKKSRVIELSQRTPEPVAVEAPPQPAPFIAKTSRERDKVAVARNKSRVVESIRPAQISVKSEPSPEPVIAEFSMNAASREDPTPALASTFEQSLLMSEKRRQSDAEGYSVLKLPDWYTKINMKSLAMKNLDSRGASKKALDCLAALKALKGYITTCERPNTPEKQLAESFQMLRHKVHQAEITLAVDKFVLRKNRMLEEDTGLPRIFLSKKAKFPWDLQADAWQLYLRWHNEIFEVDILRGIKLATNGGKDANKRNNETRSSDTLDPNWKGRVRANYYGAGDLVLGQWWPTQLCTMRDGAHGATQGGIYGEKEKGAYSIIVSGGGGYHDKDEGETISYSGTDGKDCTPTENTLRLIESCDTTHNQVRVLRSHNLPQKNPYRPKSGYRYDGLYQVVAKELVDPMKGNYRFTLVRCDGQHPIRCEKNGRETSRPTDEECTAYEKLKKDGRCQ
jgi:hypothetical protein